MKTLKIFLALTLGLGLLCAQPPQPQVIIRGPGITLTMALHVNYVPAQESFPEDINHAAAFAMLREFTEQYRNAVGDVLRGKTPKDEIWLRVTLLARKQPGEAFFLQTSTIDGKTGINLATINKFELKLETNLLSQAIVDATRTLPFIPLK